jgi:hypothetical protein
MMWSACKIRRKHAIELDEEPSVGLAQPNSAAALPLQDNHLLTEHRNLGVKARLRCERPDQDCENEPEKPDHLVSLRDSLRSSTERGFRYTHLLDVFQNCQIIARVVGSVHSDSLKLHGDAVHAVAAIAQCTSMRAELSERTVRSARREESVRNSAGAFLTRRLEPNFTTKGAGRVQPRLNGGGSLNGDTRSPE